MGKIRYRCADCRWKFYRSDEPKHCPYCSKNNLQVDKAQAAEDLLQELRH